MEKISFASGIREFSINGRGVLRFHPGDPNVYRRFAEAAEKIRKLEDSLMCREEDRAGVTQILWDADKELKKILRWVFGPENDFDEILGGVNLLAVAENGNLVITNLLEALAPVLTEGAKRCVRAQVMQARQQAESRRENQV